ncbi:MAG TPA: hypothetical protein VIQ03_05180 [Gammaproteobacteria bacterium]
MMKSLFVITALTGALMLTPVTGFSADQQKDQMRDQVYGSQLMTDQERNEYRNRMRTAKTDEERQRIRNEHHERMKIRAQEQGVTLPDEPPMSGKGMGSGPGMGQGMGQGQGKGMGR